ncbi:MAG: pyruvate kinase [Candidatus Rokubacteria bacterium RIFCSPLOWO2_02_FULL_73_56]|nr:MAG: pyruvate kinase [Candidatus Rokubacteria bacterium RIFCSPLOWO2_02_FULL_73_56]
MRRTKVVCTIGPASASREQLERLVAAGMDVARLNFSHGTHAEHAEVIALIRAGEARWGRPVAILQDLQGPKIRLGTFGAAGGVRVDLEPGHEFTLCASPVAGSAERASITHPGYLRELRPGDQVWMDDGMIQLRVEETSADAVRCRVLVGGRVSDHKGVSFPRVGLPMSCLTDKDREDLRFGIAHGVDFVAVSFVRSAADLEEVRAFLRAQGAALPLVAKLERHEMLANLGEILAQVDAVMVARGDLGVDVPLEDVPHIQKEIIRQARRAKVPVIVATQMLESMVTHLRPTRAEVSDVATAIFDGTDAIMLSAETATGRYPAEAVEVMARIAERAERAVLGGEPRRRSDRRAGFPEAIADAAASAAHTLDARAIVAFTESGFSARLISGERPDVPIIALTPSPEVRRRLALSWGVSSRLIRKVETTDAMLEEVEATLLGDGTVRPGDGLVIISGSPMWVSGTTNLMQLHHVGERH